MVITRFAPSPTGTLHIGSVRTILFNYLYAKRFNGKFRLRIEDTDKERNKQEYIENIYSTLKDLEIEYDDEVVVQSQNTKRHQEVAYQLLKDGKAYKCYCTVEELEKMREDAVKNSETPKYDRRCRELKEEKNLPYTIRLKAPLTGKLEFEDLIQGKCSVGYEHLDDMILLRSDGTSTYMFAVVVDDHDMEITHVIRGTEHLNNAYRQKLIYDACEWVMPSFAHVSLIHAEDGTKLSKRTGAKSVQEYQKEGFLKEAILNYLLRLGWSYGEDEIISIKDAIKIFDIVNVRSSAARFSLDKLLNINSYYIRRIDNVKLVQMLKEFDDSLNFSEEGWKRVQKGMNGLKDRSRTLSELAQMSKIYGSNEEFFKNIQTNHEIDFLIAKVKNNPWEDGKEEEWLNAFCVELNIKLKQVAPILREALTCGTVSPSIFEVLSVLGPDLFVKRLENAIKK